MVTLSSMKRINNRDRTIFKNKEIFYSIESIKNKEKRIYNSSNKKRETDLKWHEVPMKLTISSYFMAAIRDDLWPPSTYDDFYFSAERGLCIEFHESLPFYTVRPKSVQHPRRWLASYDNKRKKWTLHKGKLLNIEPGEPLI